MMAILFAIPHAAAKTADLLEMSEQLDQLDKQDFQAAIDRATSCTHTRNFSCAESELSKAAKAANGGKDTKMLVASRQGLANEKQQLANEIKRAEEERQVQLRREEEDRQAQLRREKKEKQAQTRREEREEREARDAKAAEDQQSNSDFYASLGAQIQQRGAEDAALLAKIHSQTNAAYAETNRRLATQAAERDRARAERDEREVDRRRDAERDRAAREEAQRSARMRVADSTPEPPQYKPQHVIIPRADLVCAAGYSWHDASGVGAKGGTCYKDSQSQVSARVGSNSGSSSDRQSSSSNTTTRQQTSTSSGNDTQSDQPTSTKPPKQPPKTEWGPIQLEALAICRKSEKNGKWWCDGPLQDDINYDSPTVEDALSSVRCGNATSAAGGTTNKGKQADVYRCGYGLDEGDRNIAKIHHLVTSQRSYICQKYQSAKCTDFYDGQDKR